MRHEIVYDVKVVYIKRRCEQHDYTGDVFLLQMLQFFYTFYESISVQ